MIRPLVVNLIVPALLLACSGIRTFSSLIEWILWWLGLTVYVLYIFITGMWFLFGYYTRYILLGSFGLVLVLSFLPVRSLPLSYQFGPGDITGLILLVLFTPLVIMALRGYRCPEGGLEASFPFRDGRYYVAHGGTSALINHHAPAGYSSYALDILKMSRFGFRARGFYPGNPERYLIFGETVYSPVEGTVVKVEDTRPDLMPPDQDRDSPAGNYLAIRPSSTDAFIFLIHLKKGSVAVKEGDLVAAGQPVAEAGNSGLSTEPHLHLHCEIDETGEYNQSGQGIPLLFNGRFLRRNHLLKC